MSSNRARTEAPTPRRLREARSRGQVARSADLTAALLMLAGGATLVFGAERTQALLLASFHTHLTRARLETPLDVASASGVLREAAGVVFVTLGPLLAVLLLVAGTANVLQVGPLFSARALEPETARLAGGAGFRERFFSLDTVVRGFRLTLSLLLVFAIAGLVVWNALGEIGLLLRVAPERAGGVGVSLFRTLLLRTGLALVALGAVDLLYQRWQHQRALRMSREELARERRTDEGDPQHREQRRRRHREILRAPAPRVRRGQNGHAAQSGRR